MELISVSTENISKIKALRDRLNAVECGEDIRLVSATAIISQGEYDIFVNYDNHAGRGFRVYSSLAFPDDTTREVGIFNRDEYED